MLVALLLAGGGAAFVFFTHFTRCSESQLRLVRVALPPNATVLNESCSSFLGPVYRATFTLPAADLPAFQASTPITNWTQDEASVTQSVFHNEVGRASSVLLGTYVDGAFLWDVAIDTSRADRYTVHLYRAFID